MKIEGKHVCEVCGTALSEDDEFCPVCALRAALSPEKTEPLSDLSSELRFEHYQVLKNEDGTPIELGRGGMGVTYKAIDTHLRCPVALKIIGAQFIGNESARSRFVREARAAASVRHSNVASVFHLGESGGNYFYVMEFVDGETLEKLIRRRGRLDVELALEILTQVTAGLTAINKQHLVHRDIKPSNIMLSWEEGRLENVKIIDLGLAKGATEDSLSMAGGFVGTPVYASPEQFAGLGTDIRSDLYSLGMTLWEMLSGKPPFHGSVAELMDQHQHTAPPFEKLNDIPEPIVALLDVLLAKDPSLRFQNPAQLQKAAARVREAFASGAPLTPGELRSTSAEATTKVSKYKPRRHLARWIIVAAFCFAVAVIAWALLSQYRGTLFNQRSIESLPTEKSIAVLPFENISPNKDDAYFADGVQDEILNNLARIAQLKVISRTSVMQYRSDYKRDLRQIASALGVANVLEGTVRRDGNHVRVSTELVDARNDNTIWADSYDRDLTDVFAIQSEIAQKVASRLSAQLSPEERKDIEEKPTDNLEAYDLYLRAKHLLVATTGVVLLTREREDFLKAISLLEEAIHKDPKFTLAYCMITKADDTLYFDRIDHTPERRALGDAAIKAALQLRSELPEVNLALASHLYTCYRDFVGAHHIIAIAARSLSNNADLLELAAIIDRAQGRWEKSTAGLERAATLDPRNPERLAALSDNYWCLRRYRDYERILDRLVELVPEQPLFPLYRAETAFAERGDLKGVLAVLGGLPSSVRDDVQVTWQHVFYSACARDFALADEIVAKSPREEMMFFGALVPRQIVALWLRLVEGNHPTMEEFSAAREQLSRKVEADRSDPFLIAALAFADVALGREQEGIEEGLRALETRPISEDAADGPLVAAYVAAVDAWANESSLAFEQLSILIKRPSFWFCYGDLKTNPMWDPLRKDPRFEKLLEELAPRD